MDVPYDFGYYFVRAFVTAWRLGSRKARRNRTGSFGRLIALVFVGHDGAKAHECEPAPSRRVNKKEYGCYWLDILGVRV